MSLKNMVGFNRKVILSQIYIYTYNNLYSNYIFLNIRRSFLSGLGEFTTVFRQFFMSSIHVVVR